MKFSELNLIENLQKGINEIGFVDCTPVQEEAFQSTLEGKDVLVQSKTGTGKTAAFLITIFQSFFQDERFKNKKALILAPTRELAVQIEEEARQIGKYCGLKIGCFYGGVGYFQQEKQLAEGTNIFIGTPGRLIDFYKSKKIDFFQMDILVIDEADRMFDMGFIKDIRFILKKMKEPKKRLTLLFSATLSYQVKSLSWDFMNEPTEIAIDPEEITAENITQEIYHVSKRDKFKLLLGIIKKENPKSMLVFTNTKRQAEEVALRLAGNNFPAEFISGDLPQKKRLQIIESVKSGETRFIVATDVAARGLHINDLQLVVNYDLPQEATSYVHRIGRTARAGKSGKAISLVDEEFVYNLEPIQKLIEIKIPEIEFENSMLLEDVSKPVFSTRRNDRSFSGKSSSSHPHQKPLRSGSEQPRRQGLSANPQPRVHKSADISHKAVPHSTKDTKLQETKQLPVKTIEPGRKPVNPITKLESAKKFHKDVTRIPVEKDSQKSGTNYSPSELKASRNHSLEERIAIYEKKYGKDFVYPRKKKGIIQKLFSFFSGK